MAVTSPTAVGPLNPSDSPSTWSWGPGGAGDADPADDGGAPDVSPAHGRTGRGPDRGEGVRRLASGFQLRARPLLAQLRAFQPRVAMAGTDGIHTIAFVIEEDQHQPLAEYCRVMLGRLQEHYEAHAQARSAKACRRCASPPAGTDQRGALH